MHNFSFKIFGCFILLFFVFNFFAIDFVYASYQKIAPGGTVTLGEFVFDDDFVATTTACTVGITDPLNVVKVASTTPMTANNDGWHFYDYTTAVNAVSGIWPSVMICGTVARGDLVIVDKSFIVDWSVVSTSTIKDVVDDSYTVTLSDFGATTVNTAYKAKLQVLNYATIPTDAASLPTVVITDSAGTVQVPAGVMTKDSNGTYSYSYSIGGSAVGGVWETVVSTVINGQTVKKNDYWSLSSSPADVNITAMPDKSIPTITANVRIDNKGTSASDFYYVYCIVSSEANLCGGSDDIDSASGTAFITAGGFINVSLTLNDVTAAGTYWFKVKARALAETNWAASTQQFIAENEFPVQEETVITVQPTVPAEQSLTTEEGNVITLNLLSGTVDAPTRFTITSFLSQNVLAVKPAPSGLFAIGGKILKLTAVDLATGLPVTSFNKNITVIFIYDDSMVGSLDETSFRIHRHNGVSWVALDNGSVNTATNRVSGTTQNFSYFAVFGSVTPVFGSVTPVVGGGGGGGGGGGVVGGGGATAAAIAPIVPTITAGSCNGADFNGDSKVNSVDFSILLAFWQKLPPFKNPCVDINKDGKVNSVDFSILLYQWKK